jgi:hypothetical protein
MIWQCPVLSLHLRKKVLWGWLVEQKQRSGQEIPSKWHDVKGWTQATSKQICDKEGSNPALLIETLAAIEDTYGSNVDEGELTAIVLDAATDKYQSVQTAEQRNRGLSLSLMDLELVMGKYYIKLTKKKSKCNKDETEVLLTGFQGACFACVEKGHRANKCPTRDMKEIKIEKRVNKNCINCAKRGHSGKDFWFKNSNKDKKPAEFKPADETAALGAATKERNLEEYMLGTIDRSQINNPDIWIDDTAATVYMSSYVSGLKNVRNTEPELVTMVNGSTEVVDKVADVAGVINNNEAKAWIQMTDVTVLNNGRFNLFSISQALKKGWKLAGDNNKIVTSRNYCQIVFDIKIKTAKWVLFATKIERNPEFCGATSNLNKKLELTEKQAHQKLGHMHLIHFVYGTLDQVEYKSLEM